MTTKARFSAEILEHVLDLPEGVRIDSIERIPGPWDAAANRAMPPVFVLKLVVDVGSDIELPEGDVELIYTQEDGAVSLREIRPIG